MCFAHLHIYIATFKEGNSPIRIMNIKIQHMPEKYMVIWTDEEGIQHREFYNTKEEAKVVKEQLDKEKPLTDN
jgi:hypothetical protein